MKTYRLACVSVLAILGLSACGSSSSSSNTKTTPEDIVVIANRPQLSAMEDDPSVADPYACGNSGVLICHIPPGNPDARHSLCIGMPATKHHIAHHNKGELGDYLGTCLAPGDTGSGGEGGTGTDGGAGTDTGSDTGTGTDTGGSTGTNGDGGQIIDCTDPANHDLAVCG